MSFVHGKGLPYNPCQYYLFFCVLLIFKYTILISAAFIAVEQVFSKGRLVLSHIWNCLSTQSTCALLCLSAWSKLGYVKLDDLKVVASLPDVMPDKTWSDEEWNVVG